MSIRRDEYSGVCVLTVEGDLSGSTVRDAARLVEGSALHDAPSVVLDLDDCDFIDSAGLELLCRVRRECEASGGRLELARVRSNCRKILQLTRLAARFECHPDLAGAVAAAR